MPAAKTKVRRYVSSLVDGATLRMAQFEGRDHLVVQAVILVGDLVVHPMGAPAPELVPARELAVAPAGWNGRPVLLNHPDPSNGLTSANDPRLLEQQSFGRLFNTVFEDGRLKSEIWIDLAAAQKIDGAQEIVRRCQAKEMVEVSVGAIVVAIYAPGEWDGRKYDYVWDRVTPDHLAMLPEGTIGACSINDGCGACRAAMDARGTIVLGPAIPKEKSVTNTPNLWQRLSALFGAGERNAETSDDELWFKLAEQIHATEAAFDGIVGVYSESNSVVYRLAPNGERHLYRRSFSLADDGTVTLSDDKTEVKESRSFEPLSSNDQPCQCGGETGSCTCEGHQQAASINPTNGPTAQGGDPMPKLTQKVTELIGRLIESGPFKEAQREFLSTMSEEQLTALGDSLLEEEGDPKPADGSQDTDPEPTPEPVTPPADAQPAQLTAEQWLRAAPTNVQAIIQRSLARETNHRAGLIRSLRALPHVAAEYDEATLKAWDTDALERFARTVGLSSTPSGESFDFTSFGGAFPSQLTSEPPSMPNGISKALERTKPTDRTAN